MAFDADIVPDPLVAGDHGFARVAIQSNRHSPVIGQVFLFERQEGFLHIQTRIFRQRLGNNQEGFGKGLQAHAGPSRRLGNNLVAEMERGGQLKGSSSLHHGSVFHSILDGPQSIPDGILHLHQRVLVGSLEQQSAGLGLLGTLFHKGKLVVSQRHLRYLASVSQHVLLQILERMNGSSTTRQGQTLHVASLGTAQTQNTLLGKHIQRQWINALLINHDKGLQQTHQCVCV